MFPPNIKPCRSPAARSFFSLTCNAAQGKRLYAPNNYRNSAPYPICIVWKKERLPNDRFAEIPLLHCLPNPISDYSSLQQCHPPLPGRGGWPAMIAGSLRGPQGAFGRQDLSSLERRRLRYQSITGGTIHKPCYLIIIFFLYYNNNGNMQLNL